MYILTCGDRALRDLKLTRLIQRNIATCEMDANPLEVATDMQKLGKSCVVLVEDQVPLGIATDKEMVRVFAEYYREESQRQLSMKDVATSPIISIYEDTSLMDALVLMESRGVRYLPVVAKGGQLQGLVTYDALSSERQQAIAGQLEAIEQEVQVQAQELSRAREQLRVLSLEDYQLNIANRRAMEQDMADMYEAALRYKRPYSVALVDIDNLRGFNRNHGHEAGDILLKTIADFLVGSLRKTDRLYRYDGGRFFLLMKETREIGVSTLLQRLLQGVSILEIQHENTSCGTVTVSIGAACMDGEGVFADFWHDPISRADQALQKAKAAGGNQYMLSGNNKESVSRQDNRSAA